MKFYLCEICGNLILKIEDSGNVPFCCGKKMQELIPASSDASVEKHVPVVTYFDINKQVTGISVQVGSQLHPSTTEHYIKWIALETDRGMQMIKLKAGDQPEAYFFIDADSELLNVYAYCNIHGLWKF